MLKKLFFLLLAVCVLSAVVVRSDEAATDATAESSTGDVFSAEQREQINSSSQKFEFQAEVGRLMDILIKYLYSNKEIFLRELISNGSDALDKIRFLSLKDSSQLGDGEESKLEIRIRADKDKKLLVIRDTGVGMTRDELIKNLGTLAKSGTTQFVDAVSQAGADTLSLIGQFGVGFYSVYLVSDLVTVASKSNNSTKQFIWESAAQGSYSISEDPRGNTLGRGTEITLRIKDDAKEFLEFTDLQRVATKYSEFINFPIYIQETKTTEKEVPVEEEAKPETTEEKKEDEVEVEDAEKQEEKPKTKKVTETENIWHLVNENKPIWTRSPKEVTTEEYNSFYKALTKDTEDPLAHIHFSAEGDVSFKALLYIPAKAASDLYEKYYGKSSSVKLYVRRVLIAEEFEELMPRYLSFVRGVVDSEDLPINVNRESLQKNKLLQVIGKKLVQKVFAMLNSLTEKEASDNETEEKTEEKKEDKYLQFWKEFGKSIRLGVMEDNRNSKKLQKLLRFPTSVSVDTPISLQTYIDRMKSKQEFIYHIAGENLKAVESSPFMEKLRKRGYEALYLIEPLDEYVIQQVVEYEGKKLQSITKEGLSLGKESDRAKQRFDAQKDEFKALCTFLEKTYGSSRVEKVVVSNRIAQSPAVIVTGQYGWSSNMERIMRAQALGDNSKTNFMISKRTMEINPNHPIIQEMKARVAADSEDSKLKDLTSLLYDAAALNSGFSLEDPKEFGDRIYRTIASSLNVSSEAPVAEDDEVEEEEEEEHHEEESNESEPAPKDEL